MNPQPAAPPPRRPGRYPCAHWTLPRDAMTPL